MNDEIPDNFVSDLFEPLRCTKAVLKLLADQCLAICSHALHTQKDVFKRQLGFKPRSGNEDQSRDLFPQSECAQMQIGYQQNKALARMKRSYTSSSSSGQSQKGAKRRKTGQSTRGGRGKSRGNRRGFRGRGQGRSRGSGPRES